MTGFMLHGLEQLARAAQIGRRWWGASTLQCKPPLGRRDAAFIAAASPDVVLALLDQLDAAEAALARARRLHDDWMEQANANSEQGGDFWAGMTVKGRDCADGLRRALDGGEQS